MTVLITSDLHFTSNPRDKSRWDLFPWLKKQVKKTGAKTVIICGDICDQKDRHPAELVNRLVGNIEELAQLTEVTLLRGNHDYIDIDCPFFAFLNNTHNIHFITEPTYVELDDGVNGARTHKLSLFLPNTRDYKTDWKDLDLKKVRYVFCHQTFDGAETENGTKLGGIPAGFFKDYPDVQVWSGDIHVPQRVGPKGQVRYVGAPYRVHFGDNFTPRVVLLRRGESEDLHFPTVSKELVEIKRIDRLERYDFPEGTQVKVRMKLRRGDFPMWKEYKRTIIDYAAEHKWELYGPELVGLPDDKLPDDDAGEANVGAYRKPSRILKDYASANKLDKELTTVGLELLKVV